MLPLSAGLTLSPPHHPLPLDPQPPVGVTRPHTSCAHADKGLLHILTHAISTDKTLGEDDWSYFELVNVDFEAQSREATWSS